MRYGLDEEAAFALLRHYSQRVNVKVRDVARELVVAVANGGLPPADGALWDQLAVEVAAEDSETEAAG